LVTNQHCNQAGSTAVLSKKYRSELFILDYNAAHPGESSPFRPDTKIVNKGDLMTHNVVLITGSSTGFGRLMATTLAQHHYEVFASMRDVEGRNRGNASELRKFAERENVSLRVIEMDVTDDSSVQKGVDQVIQHAGAIDVVINNAGVADWGLVEAFSVEQAKAIFETNFFGALRVNRAVLPHMRERRTGVIVHISSAAGRLVVPSMGIYAASKFALEAMAETLRYELSQLGIDSILIEPGPYPTAIFGKGHEPADQARATDYGPLADIPAQVRQNLASFPSDPQEVVTSCLN
jgi:NAD(P)-dependent dehydrogenase (short-subunit alcohol dehydrogenase family)